MHFCPICDSMMHIMNRGWNKEDGTYFVYICQNCNYMEKYYEDTGESQCIINTFWR